ncbi:MAG TPA: hypothetical protein HA340_04050 [Candidatus Thalassarchaeaceae archaeon]|nr:hypothetical protein [Candidatus Thalassarchaeaceae archaeon]
MSGARQWKKFKRAVTKPLVEAWEKQRAKHLVILGMLSVLAAALIVWAIAFFMIFSSNAQQEANAWENYTAVTWVGVLTSFVILIFVIPEFFHYLGVRNSLIDMLDTDSRAELNSNKRDLVEGVKLLAGAWPARYEAKKVELGLRKEMPDGMELPLGDDGWISNWFGTKNSRFVERFPNSELLQDPGINKIFIFASLTGLVIFVYNAVFGLAREVVGGPRNMTVDFTAIIKGSQYNATWAPHFDLVGGLIILSLAVILFMTSPTPSEQSDDNSDSATEEE